MVTVVGVEVTGDDVLEVPVLPVQVAGLNGPCEYSPVGAHFCRGSRWRSKRMNARSSSYTELKTTSKVIQFIILFKSIRTEKSTKIAIFCH